MKKILIIFLVLFIIAMFIRDDINEIFAGKVVAVEKKEVIPIEYGEIEILFCQIDDCENNLIRYIQASENVDCSFFDFNLEKVMKELKNKDYRLIVDDRNLDKVKLSNVRSDKRNALMHNKFCVFDDSSLVTGSMNPTMNDVKFNDNNLVFIKSKSLVENYKDEFEEMWKDEFGGGGEVKNSKIMFNGFLIENYFCPEDCVSQLSSDYSNDGWLNKLLYLVEQADRSIKIAAFTFTSDRLRDALIKAHYYGIDVKVVMERRNANGLGSEYNALKEAGIDIKLDENKGNMHHKFMIIDDDIVEFGSYNYGKNANDKNDENILIIYNSEVARKFSEEFDRIYNLAD